MSTTQLPVSIFSENGIELREKIFLEDYVKKISELGIPQRFFRMIEAPVHRIEASLILRTFEGVGGIYGHEILILNVEGIKVLCLSQEATVFVVETPTTEAFLTDLRETLQNRTAITEQFQSVILESALNIAFTAIKNDLEIIHSSILSFSTEMGSTSRIKDIIKHSETFPLKAKIQRIRKRAFEFVRALSVFLDDQNDSQSNFLRDEDRLSTRTSQYTPGVKRTKRILGASNTSVLVKEAENIADKFSTHLRWMIGEMDGTINKIALLEVEATLQLELMRNRIMRYNLYISMGMLAIALTALIPGIFGMNLQFPPNLYTDGNVFYVTVSCCAVAVPGIFFILVSIGHFYHIY